MLQCSNRKPETLAVQEVNAVNTVNPLVSGASTRKATMMMSTPAPVTPPKPPKQRPVEPPKPFRIPKSVFYKGGWRWLFLSYNAVSVILLRPRMGKTTVVSLATGNGNVFESAELPHCGRRVTAGVLP